MDACGFRRGYQKVDRVVERVSLRMSFVEALVKTSWMPVSMFAAHTDGAAHIFEDFVVQAVTVPCLFLLGRCRDQQLRDYLPKSFPAMTVMPCLLLTRTLLVNIAVRRFRVERRRNRTVGRVRRDSGPRKTCLPVEEIKIIIQCPCKCAYKPFPLDSCHVQICAGGGA